MPIAIFVGRNSQLQCIIFVQALLSDEWTYMFEWVLGHFRQCMDFKDPMTIFTSIGILLCVITELMQTLLLIVGPPFSNESLVIMFQ
jgi:hypothetical protein